MLFNAIAVNDKLSYISCAQLRWLTEANKHGKPVCGQVGTARAANYITFEGWNLYDSNPTWREATTGTLEEKKAKLANPRIRAGLREDYDSGATKSLDCLFGELKAFIVHQVHRADLKKYEGMSVGQIAEQEHKHPVDAMLDVSVADNIETIGMGPIANNDVENYRD